MFDTQAQERLGYYVYGLFDSAADSQWPFYIGKGCGNRVFAHAKGELIPHAEDEPLSHKLRRIHDIKSAGRSVVHKIIRFGLSEEEAFKIEAALIDMVNCVRPDTLKNQISGHGVAEGIYDAKELAATLGAKELDSDLPLLIVKIERLWDKLVARYGSASAVPVAEIYEATKGNWKLRVERAKRAACVLAVARGLVRAAFVPSDWVEVEEGKRKQMTGLLDGAEFQHLVGMSVAHLFQRGSQAPVRYLRC